MCGERLCQLLALSETLQVKHTRSQRAMAALFSFDQRTVFRDHTNAIFLLQIKSFLVFFFSPLISILAGMCGFFNTTLVQALLHQKYNSRATGVSVYRAAKLTQAVMIKN